MTTSTSSDERPSPEFAVRVGATVTEPSADPDPADVGPSVEAPARDEPVPAPVATRRARRVRAAPSPAMAIYGAALSIVAALMLGFAADLSFVGALHHHRDQMLAYDTLRYQLAKGTAPIGPIGSDGRPVPTGAPVALLQIPEIGLTEVIFEGTSAGVLEKGVGHARSSVLPGQVGTSVIMGRRAAFGGPFRDIGTLRPRQEFTVTTGQAVNRFQVLDIRRAGDPIPTAPAAGAGRLQLITATGPMYRPTGVVRVDADLISDVQGAPALTVNIAPLLKSEYPLQGDPSVLMPLVLWGQALLLAAGLVAWARVRWGFWQSWIVGLPLLTALGLAVADRVAQLLPNLM